MIAGAIPHAPIQRKASRVNKPSSDVSPGLIFKISENLFNQIEQYADANGYSEDDLLRLVNETIIYFNDGQSHNINLDVYCSNELVDEIAFGYDFGDDYDYTKEDNTNNYELLKRFQHLIHTSQIRNNLNGMSFADVDTIHFSNKYKNSIELIQQVRQTIVPTPVNYNNAKISGWVD